MNLDPAKLLVILVIALVVLGPERLPRVARQLGALWREMTVTRERLVNEIKQQVPDLPDPRDLRSMLFDPTKPVGNVVNGVPQNGSQGVRESDDRSTRSHEPQTAPQDRNAGPAQSERSDPSMN